MVTPKGKLILFDYDLVGKAGVKDEISKEGIGTEGFAAPEQYDNYSYCIGWNKNNNDPFTYRTLQPNVPKPAPTFATDTYALAMTFMHMYYREILNTSFPENNEPSGQSISAWLYDQLIRHPQINPELIDVLITATNFDLNKRQQSVDLFFGDLANALSK